MAQGTGRPEALFWCGWKPPDPERGRGAEEGAPREAWDSKPRWGRSEGARPPWTPPGKAQTAPGDQGMGTGGRAPCRHAEVRFTSPPTSEHRLGPRDHGNHHGLFIVLSFLTLERHLEAVERRGSFCSQCHGEAEKGDPIAEDGHAGLGAPPVAAASHPGPRRARESSSSAARPAAHPASHSLQLVTTPGGEGSIRGPRPRRSLLWRLIVSVRPAAPPPGPDGQSREGPPQAPPQARAGQNRDRRADLLLASGPERPGVAESSPEGASAAVGTQQGSPTCRWRRGRCGAAPAPRLLAFPRLAAWKASQRKKSGRGVGRTSAQNILQTASLLIFFAPCFFLLVYTLAGWGGGIILDPPKQRF